MTLSAAEYLTLYSDGRRLEAYYYSFEPTGVPEIDAILSAVAYAGKGQHHTQWWSDDDDEYSYWGVGRSYIDVIQDAANEAARGLAHANNTSEA